MQETPIPVCTSFTKFPKVGISIYLFFQTIQNLMFLLLFLIFSFGAYSFASNCYISGIFKKGYSFKWDEYQTMIVQVSLASKKLTQSSLSTKMYLI